MTPSEAHSYVRRRRVVIALVALSIASFAAFRAQASLERASLLDACEAQRAHPDQLVGEQRRYAGLVQVRTHSMREEPVLPAQGDVVVTANGVWLAGEGRVLPLNASCEEALP